MWTPDHLSIDNPTEQSEHWTNPLNNLNYKPSHWKTADHITLDNPTEKYELQIILL